MNDLDALLKSRGVSRQLGAQVTGCAFTRAGLKAGFALGDGSVHFADGETWSHIQAHDGAVLAFAADCAADGFISGGDDGKFLRVKPETVSQIGDFGMMKWVDQVAAFAHAKTPLLACSVGKNLHLFNGAGGKLRSLAHPSTVTGIAFDAKGKRIAASHYNGASLWFTASESGPRLLEWKGSHIGVALHPEGEALVTAMQENALHGWTLPEGKHMRMSGYPAKPESFGFTRSGKWLATAGADTIVLWPFFGGGPMGKPPLELGGTVEGNIVKRLACHPQHEVVAAGFEDGLVMIADIARSTILPVAAAGRGAVTGLAWNGSGSHLAFGTAEGFAAVVDFSSAG